MNHLILAIFFLIFYQIADCQYIINGIIKSHDNNTPIEYATIELKNKGIGTVSDSLGQFQISSNSRNNTLQISSIFTEIKTVECTLSGIDTFILIELAPKQNLLNEVVVTGTMKEMSRSASPVPVEIITPQLFRKNPTPSLIESVGMITGVKPQINCNVCNTGDIHINGMEGPYTTILIDGMPIVSALSTVYGLNGIPNSLIERIEVVKGPASSLYGSEAMGGIINVITKSTYRAPKFSIDLFGTDWKEYNVDLGLKLHAGKGAGLFGINYFNYQNPEDRNKDGFTDMTLQNRISLFNKWDFEASNNKVNSIVARYVYEDRWGGQTNWSKSYRGGDSIYGESIYTNRLELIGKYSLPTKKNISMQYSYNMHLQDSYYGITSYQAKQQTGFAQLLWEESEIVNHSLLFGLSSRYTWYDDNTPATYLFEKKNKPSVTFLPGLFIQDEYQIDKKQVLLSGLRLDYDKHHGAIISPRLAYKFAPDYKHTFRFSLGTGYRVVNLFTEDHAALTGSREVIVLEDLLPERSYNGNFNFVKKIFLRKNFIGIDLTAFYSYFTNRIIGDFTTDANKIIYANLDGHAISTGSALNIDYAIGANIKLLAGVNYMDVYQVQGGVRNQQIHAPRWSGTTTMTFANAATNKYSFDLTSQWNGPMRLPIVPNDFRPEYSPWHALINIQITKKTKYNAEWYGGIKNILNFVPSDPLLRPFDPFDKHVADPVNNPHGYTFDTGYNYAPLQGRRLFLGVRYKVG